jgi:putative mRNA 3-end processing factor
MLEPSDLLTLTDAGLYCPEGDFHIDPWQPVPRAVITHAHADHARPGSTRYLTAADGARLLQHRMGVDAVIDTLEYGEPVTLGGVKVSLHPAGHVLGSAQVRIERASRVCVVSGDYKTAADPTCAPLEVLRCHTFITESTFGLPIYRWPSPTEAIAELAQWWSSNRDEGRASILYAYALGKAQRLIASLSSLLGNRLPGPIFCHGAVENLNASYRASGVDLPPTQLALGTEGKRSWDGALVVAPPSAAGSLWLRKFGDISTAFASGWMLVRGQRRRRAVDRGIVVSDHADWPGLCETIQSTGAERVFVTHGAAGPMVRWLRERGLFAAELSTRFEGELAEPANDADAPSEESDSPA